jgi:hypothetical protein
MVARAAVVVGSGSSQVLPPEPPYPLWQSSASAIPVARLGVGSDSSHVLVPDPSMPPVQACPTWAT